MMGRVLVGCGVPFRQTGFRESKYLDKVVRWKVILCRRIPVLMAGAKYPAKQNVDTDCSSTSTVITVEIPEGHGLNSWLNRMSFQMSLQSVGSIAVVVNGRDGPGCVAISMRHLVKET